MDLGFIFPPVIELFVKFWNLSFTVFGLEVTVGAFIVWSAIVGMIIGFLRR